MNKTSVNIVGLGGMSASCMVSLAGALRLKADEIEASLHQQAGHFAAEAPPAEPKPKFLNAEPCAALFALDMGEMVRVGTCNSTEIGEVIGRCESNRSEDSYLIRYIAGDGRATEAWWGVSALYPL